MRILLFIFCIILAASVSDAQTISHDSAMVESANIDAKGFKLDGNTFKKFRRHHFPITSDYFKPSQAYASDTSLLNDSAYVKAFRLVAYKKTLHHRTTGHYVLVIGSITVAALTIAGILLLSTSDWVFTK